MNRLLQTLYRSSPAFIGACAGIGFGIALVPQTLGLSFYQQKFASLKDDNAVDMDKQTTQLVYQVMSQLKMNPDDDMIKFFVTYESEPIHRGSTALRTGAIVGIPALFAAKSITDLEQLDLKLKNQSFPWKSEEGEELARTLSLSENAKKFMIARELVYATTYHVQWSAGLKVIFGVLAYCAGHLMNVFLNLQHFLKTWARGNVYILVASCSACLYIMVWDTYNCLRDNKVDKKVASLGQEYSQGGVEYYTKLLRRNVILRSMMGSSGENLFTKFGNDKTYIRRKHVQTTTRRDNLEKYLEQFYSNQGNVH